jgi:predicted transglutaminase-like cysteine proteinase
MISLFYRSDRVRCAASKAVLMALVAGAWPAFSTDAQTASAAARSPEHLDLTIIDVVDRYPPYAQFCSRKPDACVLQGAAMVTDTPALRRTLNTTNAAVNHEITFALDSSQFGIEDYWSLPTSGYGDCEDIALEKRSRLSASGMASRALRLAFVFHKQHLSSHCVLTVETSSGTYVLDSFAADVFRWDRGPYNFEARERVDGRWDRFDQNGWTYD